MNRVFNFTAIAVSSAVFLVCGDLNAAVLQTLTQTVDGITWSYTVNKGIATVGNDTVSPIVPAIPESTSGAITIPSTLGGYPVTRIGENAFSFHSKMTNVMIPDSVTSIGNSAFTQCRGLTSISLGDSITYIGTNSFFNCIGLTSVTLPSPVRIIDKGAFQRCTGLTSVNIPNSVTTISEDAFDECSRLWSGWFRSLADGRAYDLTQTAGDRAIASVTVNADSAIDSFVLKGGKVYDSVLYINNTADHAVTLTLPSGYVYKAIKGATPLRIPANTQCILSITRVAEQVFIVSREDLETIQ